MCCCKHYILIAPIDTLDDTQGLEAAELVGELKG